MKISKIVLSVSLSFLISCISASFAQDQPQTIEQNKREAIRLYNQSIKPLQDGDYANALKLLESASKLDDSQPLIQNNYGLALLKTGETDEALQHLLKATTCKPAPAIAWMNLGNAYETKRQYKDAIDSFQKYLSLAPTSLDAPKIRAHIDLVQKEFIADQNAENYSKEDYLSAVTRKVKLRWAIDKMPIKIYLDTGKDVAGFKPEYGLLLNQAIDDWIAASDGKITIRIVDAKDNADIVTRWSNDLSEVVSVAEGGDVKYRGGGKGLISVAITLLTVNPSSSMKLTPNVVSWVTHHEVGHALGLLGHSPEIDDVMYFSAPQADKPAILSQRDKNTIVKLYSVALGPTMLTLNDDGIEAQKKGDQELAIQKYKAATEMDPSADIPRRNLIRAEHAMAVQLIKQGNLSRAEIYFKEALALEDKAPDENLAVLLKNYSRLLKIMHRDSEADSLKAKYKNSF